MGFGLEIEEAFSNRASLALAPNRTMPFRCTGPLLFNGVPALFAQQRAELRVVRCGNSDTWRYNASGAGASFAASALT